jgi:hypothetical protein
MITAVSGQSSIARFSPAGHGNAVWGIFAFARAQLDPALLDLLDLLHPEPQEPRAAFAR